MNSAVSTRRDEHDGACFFDVFLEALSYLRDGSWSTFEDAFESTAGVHDAPDVSPRDVARTLSALGHIDVVLERYSFRPQKWAIGPATLFRVAEGSYVLCGQRSTGLFNALNAHAAPNGFAIRVEPLEYQPARVVITAAEGRGDLEALVRSVTEEYHDLLVNDLGTGSLAAALPPLSEVVDALKRAAPPHGGTVERARIEGRRLSWAQADDYFARGSYRFNPPPVTYGYVESENAVPVRVDARLARLLALIDAGQETFAWDPETGVAEARYYAEPPVLYERALVLCSGYVPTSLPREGITRYRDVTAAVGAFVHAALLPRPTGES
jgi:hypothetical protein